ncbi:MAG: DUF3795 domain-containing protein [Bacteroidales bacterium]|jgi:hypothetical protein|nr:DUF3795 domain-containing protein [Bacteroidales bacterium]
MKHNNILNSLGPCGLNCSKCFAFKNGAIKQLSLELKENLGNFDIYAKRFVELLDELIFKKYSDFKEILNHFSNVECNGCRKDECKLFLSCKVKHCSKDQTVEFCFECSEFPCSKHGFDEHLEKRWLSIQTKMRKIGVEGYYNEIKNLPRY